MALLSRPAFLRFAALVAASAFVAPGCGPPDPGETAPAPVAESAAPDPLLGSWRPQTYRIGGEEPTELPVDGRIVFLPGSGEDPGEWSVLFFVNDEGGEPRRGSAEGGQWFREGETLVLTHAWHLSAGAAVGPLSEAPLRMELRSMETAARDHREPCRVGIEGDGMTLFFPSGNSMSFVRISGP